jgi:Flp pilus assembly protein TadD
VGLDATIVEKQLAAQIEARFAALSGKRDHFVILGVQESASKDQVKAAFLNLAKVFHPDRLPASLKEHAEKMSRVFEAIREAYEILGDDTKRAAYLAAQKAAQGPTPTAQAVEFFKVGDAQFKKRDFKGAEENFGKAHAIDQGATSLAARAWAIYMDPTRKAEGVAARKMMADALKLDPTCDRAHYQLGVIARVEGDMDRAEKHFKEAIAKNPKHLEAAQELRLIEMRKKKGNLYNK